MTAEIIYNKTTTEITCIYNKTMAEIISTTKQQQKLHVSTTEQLQKLSTTRGIFVNWILITQLHVHVYL
jgi:hypothetical protein